GRADVEDDGMETEAVQASDSVAGPEPGDDGPVEQVEPQGSNAPVNLPEPVSVGESTEAPESSEPGAAAIAVNCDAVVPAANGHDNGQGLDIPEFLRRV
ncbi:MAG: hypothetical protein OXK20_05405, partial [Deltaproteobacteria bacterium]|nr:hypothetical protein [Deltaproteobacteria bacterium]